MPSAPKIHSAVAHEIARRAVDRPTVGWKTIRDELEDWAKERGYRLPGPDNFAKRIREARKSLDPRFSWEDRSWSLASLEDRDPETNLPRLEISDDALPDVLSVWRASVASRVNFTNRRAKWAAHLRRFAVDDPVVRPLELGMMAGKYALDEAASLALGQPFNTSENDAMLACGLLRWDPPRPKSTTIDLGTREVRDEWSIEDRVRYLVHRLLRDRLRESGYFRTLPFLRAKEFGTGATADSEAPIPDPHDDRATEVVELARVIRQVRGREVERDHLDAIVMRVQRDWGSSWNLLDFKAKLRRVEVMLAALDAGNLDEFEAPEPNWRIEISDGNVTLGGASNG